MRMHGIFSWEGTDWYNLGGKLLASLWLNFKNCSRFLILKQKQFFSTTLPAIREANIWSSPMNNLPEKIYSHIRSWREQLLIKQCSPIGTNNKKLPLLIVII